jgi:hypothetical protein
MCASTAPVPYLKVNSLQVCLENVNILAPKIATPEMDFKNNCDFLEHSNRDSDEIRAIYGDHLTKYPYIGGISRKIMILTLAHKI